MLSELGWFEKPPELAYRERACQAINYGENPDFGPYEAQARYLQAALAVFGYFRRITVRAFVSARDLTDPA